MTMGLSDEEVCDVASRICRTIRNADIPHINNVGGDRLTLSVGVANVPITDKTDTILEIANYADKAVYYAKNAGKNAIYELVHGGLGEKETGAAFVKIDF